MNGVQPIHAGERIPVLEAIGEQASELADQESAQVTCPCGTTGHIELMFRCFYCHVWFCPDCAGDHFSDGDPDGS